MTKAFIVCFVIGLILAWISLSIDHGKSFGKDIKKTFKEFLYGKKAEGKQ